MFIKRKKALLFSIMVAIFSLFAVGATLAYLTDVKSVLNTLGIGIDGGPDPGINPYVSIEISEPEYERITTDRKLYDILPGDRIIKDPQIKNIGSTEIYTRVYIYKGEDESSGKYTKTELEERFGITINDSWLFHEPTCAFYYVGNSKQIEPMEKGIDIELFETKQGDVGPFTTEGGQYTLKISETLTNNDIGYVDILNITAEAIQERNFTPGSMASNDPWQGSGRIISNK